MIQYSTIKSGSLCFIKARLCVCVERAILCVCVRERERERESAPVPEIVVVSFWC